MGRIQDGTEARRLLSRLLLGIDDSPVRLWSDEPLMGASISGFVLLEKVTSANQLFSRLGGVVFIVWAAWIVFGSQS